MDIREVILKLQEIESTLQDRNSDANQLKVVVDEMRKIVQSFDKDLAIHAEKQAHLLYRVEQLQQELSVLANRGEKGTDRQRDLVEKALMAVLGGLITYIFSLAKGS